MKKYISLLIFVFVSLISYSQENIIEWKTSVSRIEDGSYNLIIDADIHSDWYIYGMNIGGGGPLPLVLIIKDSESDFYDVSFSEISTPDKVFDEVFGMEVESYSKKAEFKCNFVPKSGIKYLNLIIEGQACNKNNGLCVQISETISCEIHE